MSSTKSQTRRYTFQVTRKHFANTGSGAIVFQGTYSKVLDGAGQVTYGDNLRDWKKRIALHMSATTTLSATSTLSVTMTPGFIVCNSTYPYPIWTDSGDILARHAAIPGVSVAMDSVAEKRAASKFLSHYIKKTNTWRGGNFLAEIRETWHMLHNPVKSFYHKTWEFAGKVGKLRNVSKQKRRHVVDTIADAWLAYGFGVKPLISDANDATAALNKLKNEMGGTGQDSTMVSGYGDNKSLTKSAGLPLTTVAGDSDLNNKYDSWLIEHRTVRYRCALKAHLEDLTTVGKQFGVDVFDVIPAVWEAIPWSFFIDYFANVGEMLDSCRLASAEVAWCNRTVRNSSALTLNGVRHVPTPSLPTCSISGNPRFYALARYVNRTPSSIPYPSFGFKVPGLDSTKWLNIAALTEQIFTKRPTF